MTLILLASDLGYLGAEILVPGLEAMILHHEMFYRDLSDPVALLRSKSQRT